MTLACEPPLFAKDTGNGAASIIQSGTSNGAICNTNVTNCILWDNTTPLITNYKSGTTTVTYSDIQGGYAGTNNIAANPLFFDFHNDDYRVASCSPCVNAGTAIGAPNDDLNGNTRPIKGMHDIGAYESLDTGIITTTISMTISPNDTFCEGSLVHLTSTTNAPAGNYEWKVNETVIGSNSPVYSTDSLSNADIISCKVSSNASCLNPNTATDNLTVNVKPLPVADFSMSNSGLDYSFNNTSTNDTGLIWHFGDGTTSTLSNPTHTYVGNGNYTVMLIVDNDCGADTFTQNINQLTGIEQIITEELVSISPNPNMGSFMIELKGLTEENQSSHLKILNLLGETILQQELLDTHNVVTLTQPSGIYLAIISTTKGEIPIKLLVH